LKHQQRQREQELADEEGEKGELKRISVPFFR
jgi:hypothetical protein